MTFHFTFIVVPTYLQNVCSKTPQWMPETADDAKPYTNYDFSYTYIPIKV